MTDPFPTEGRDDIWNHAETCLLRTAEAIQETRASTPAELSQAVSAAREAHAQGKPADLLDVLARIQGHDEEHVGPVILSLGDKVAATQSPYAPLLPFAGKLIAPSAFYDSFDQVHRIARVLLSPVVYAEDTDAIGTASANPVAAAILADEIRAAVFKRFGIRPFVTIARLDYESWTFLTRKHFEL
ncbi:hypothetical protein JIN84_06695 [Luteolibacter yonseiensis]|uniref:Uncharacterized protein n=1 Tax=Luteolibacter yonseiensis TaxID=1144680 RepID=A0A934R3A8_9BACT|nr:hypothetical protein [Luteolibacter yonseiensis]MBK1815293.1 hypothetical protein [Luteolibacter yonseiensis]